MKTPVFEVVRNNLIAFSFRTPDTCLGIYLETQRKKEKKCAKEITLIFLKFNINYRFRKKKKKSHLRPHKCLPKVSTSDRKWDENSF